MALNCKLCTSKSKLQTNKTKVKKKEKLQGCAESWRWSRLSRKLLVAWVLCAIFGFVLVFFGFNENEVLISKDNVLDLWDEKARILQERFNVSKDQLISMATLFVSLDQKTSLGINDLRLKQPLVNCIPCALEELSSDKEKFELWQKWSANNIEGRDQCLIRDIFVPEKPEVTLKRKQLVQTVLSQNTIISLSDDQICGKIFFLLMRALQCYKQEQCESLPKCLFKICLCFIFGIMVSWKVAGCQEGLWFKMKWQQVQKKPQTKLQMLQKQKQHLQSSSKGGGKWRRKLLILFLLSGVIGSAWLYWFMNKNTIVWRTEMIANMCDERARMLQDQFNVSMNHVHALAILVSTFHHGKKPSAIDQKTFAEYTERTAFERPLTSGVAYASKVLHSERENFEKMHGWTIKKMEEEDHSAVHDYIPEKLDPSPPKDEYAPVIFSQETVSHIVSIDMMSGKEDRENILRARASGKGALTPPFKLLKSNHLGVVLTFAVYNTKLPVDAKPEQRIEATEGYLGASYDVPSLVEKLLHQLASKQTIVVNVFDTTNESAPINMYGPNATDTGLLHISNLEFGDPYRRHQMHCRFKQKPPPPWTAIMASTGFLVITLLLGHIFHAAINRIAKVEGDYREMMELKIRAEAADVAKSQFLATVSHEIRTPMNGVLGMLQMLMDTDLNANQLDYAQTAHSSGKDLISLINEVLDQAKIESGRLELEAVQFEPRSVLDNVLSLFAGKSHDKGIELAVYISDSVPEVVIGDPGRFRQIITNLVGNSIKFTEGGHIFVSVHREDEVRIPLEVKDAMLRQQLDLVRNGGGTCYNTLSGLPVVNRWKSWQSFQTLSNVIEASEVVCLLVTVEDTGVGIPRDAQSRIFMPFMQADSSTSRTYGGTGIGLSISKCLVDMMGGEIGFVSEPGTGSTFSLAVSFRKRDTNTLNIKQHRFQTPVSEFRGLRALVVDGKDIRAEVTKYHLRRLGIHVDIAISPKDICTHVSNKYNTSEELHLDMVLLDKDGWYEKPTLALSSVLKELRQCLGSKSSGKCPKVFLLATSSSSELDKFKSAGWVDDVIMKPLRLSMLTMCFQQVFGEKTQRKVKPPFLQSLLNGKHILVVDDNSVNRRVAEGALLKYGAKVTCVESGKAAIKMLQPPHKFDACFMDLQMPEMDGFEATRHIRCVENEINEMIQIGEACNEIFGNVVHWHTPILAMTADVIQATHEKCLKCGMDGFVSKPFEEEQLYSAVMHFFES
ncbi:Histidine kinase [Thalictrum thalictroides]|uniref:histidine kinase n=1 Tax=Thalictrum thalictroides TaxID=46969 RepID=A0A7J6XCR0_THATH|nr:Histidine kinase [Thalictrum thalictroides]